MTGVDYRMRMEQACVGVQFFLELPDVTDLLGVIEDAHTLGPILDPSLYRDGMQNLQWQTTMLRAISAFQKALAPLRDEILAAGT